MNSRLGCEQTNSVRGQLYKSQHIERRLYHKMPLRQQRKTQLPLAEVKKERGRRAVAEEAKMERGEGLRAVAGVRQTRGNAALWQHPPSELANSNHRLHCEWECIHSSEFFGCQLLLIPRRSRGKRGRRSCNKILSQQAKVIEFQRKIAGAT